MIRALRRLNEALPELIFGIVVYGTLAEIVGLLFVKDNLGYTVGLLIGLALAIFMAIHIALVIEESVRLGGGAEKRLAVKSVFRYLVVAVVLFAMMWLHIGSLLGAFIGIIGLKVSAYAQPVWHRNLFKVNPTEDSEVSEAKGEVGE